MTRNGGGALTYANLALPEVGATSGIATSASGAPLQPANEFSNEVYAFNADVQALPSATSIATETGPAKRGTPVVVSGSNFEGVTAVDFGSVPASSFSVDSEGQITAIAPVVTAGGEVPVTVTTLAGSAMAATHYTYQPAQDGAPTASG